MPNLRVVVFCLAFEVQKPLKAIEFYKADKAYMVYLAKEKVYLDFKKAIEDKLPADLDYTDVETTVYKFGPTLKELLRILKEEKSNGNHVYVSIDGPPSYSAAAMTACMFENAQPFFNGTKEHQVDASQYYDGKEPVGFSIEAWDPLELPIFSLNRPDDSLVHGLAVWKEIHDRGGLMTDTNIITSLAEKDLMEDVFDERDRVTQKAKMKYRRGFLDKWVEKGWVRSLGRGEYEITEYGKVAVEVF